jgi:hypothetical protein
MPSFPTPDDLYTAAWGELTAAGTPFAGAVAGTDVNLEAIVRAVGALGGTVSAAAELTWNEIDIEVAGKATLAKWYAVAGLTWPGDDEITADEARNAVKGFFQGGSAGTLDWYRTLTLNYAADWIGLCEVYARLTGPRTVHIYVGRAGGADPYSTHLDAIQAWWDNDDHHLAGDEIYVKNWSELAEMTRVVSG